MGCGGGRRRRHRSIFMAGCGLPIPPLFPAPHCDDQRDPPDGQGWPRNQDQHNRQDQSHRQQPGTPASAPPKPGLAEAADDLRQKQAELRATEEEIATLIQWLETKLRGLRDEMVQYEALARELVTKDESAARQYLERRQAAATQAASLEERVAELKLDQERVQELKSDLEIKILDLNALSHRDRLLQLESELKGLKRNS